MCVGAGSWIDAFFTYVKRMVKETKQTELWPFRLGERKQFGSTQIKGMQKKV